MSNSSTGFTYTVRQLKSVNGQPYRSPHYEVAKFGDDAEPTDVYDVVLHLHTGSCWCSCMGFLKQKSPKDNHKHVRLVMLFRKLGEPAGAVFEIEPDGNPKLIGNLLGEEEGGDFNVSS